MGVPRVYRGGGEGAIASYDYVDLANGLGYSSFYGAKSIISGAAISYVLMPSVEVGGSAPGSGNPRKNEIGCSAAQGSQEFNFDTSVFNLPRIVKGNAIITFGAGMSGGNSDTDDSIAINIYRVDANNVEHSIATQTTFYFDVAASPKYNFLGFINLTETKIKKGEKLRLSVLLQGVDATGANDMFMGVSPTDDATTNITPSTDGITSVLKINIPFKIQN